MSLDILNVLCGLHFYMDRCLLSFTAHSVHRQITVRFYLIGAGWAFDHSLSWNIYYNVL